MVPPELQFFSEVQGEVDRLRKLPLPQAVACGALRMRPQQDRDDLDGIVSLLGSVLKARFGIEFPGGGSYRFVRCAPTTAKHSSSQSLVAVSTRGGAQNVEDRDAAWFHRYVGRFLPGVLSDNTAAGGKRGANADHTTQHGMVRLVPINAPPAAVR